MSHKPNIERLAEELNAYPHPVELAQTLLRFSGKRRPPAEEKGLKNIPHFREIEGAE